MGSYVLVEIGEMVLCKALQCHMLASQGLGSGEVCRVGVRDDCSKGEAVVQHAWKSERWIEIFRFEM